jgi:osmotically-inducible protein OsmY
VDFAYLALTFGMTFQISDTAITAKRVRREPPQNVERSPDVSNARAITGTSWTPALLDPPWAQHQVANKEHEMDMVSNQVELDVLRALADDPRLPYADEIAVHAYDGAVTLRGTVGSFAQDRAAVADTRRTRGVIDVYDDLHVRLLDQDRREDAEIRGALLQRLMWDPALIPDYLDVHVKDGWVTLTGEVDHQYQSDDAFDHATSLHGVRGVSNEIKVVERL